MRTRALVLCGVFLAVRVAGWASDDEAALAIATEGGRSTYQVGERIPIELSFTGPGNKQFETTRTSGQRSHLSYEDVDVEPRGGWSDPLARYFSGGFVGSELSSLGVLSPTPILMHLNLNQWVRFEQPGSYTLVVTSHRVRDKQGASRSVSEPSDFSLRSNPIQIQIVAASSEWQKTKLASIVGELSSGAATPAREAAIADLRYLGTSEAAAVMARHLRDDEPGMMYECAFGLMGLPEAVRPKAIAAMNKLIRDPSFPVSEWFISTLTALQVEPSSPERVSGSVWESVANAVPDKTGSARAVTVETLLFDLPKEMTQQRKAELGAVLSASLKDLPADKQVSVLEGQWSFVESPSLLPVLKQLARKPLKTPGSNDGNSYTTRELKSIALRRWYQLDPEGARQEIVRQIGSAQPSMTAESLYFLENARFPEFEGVWADAFAAATEYEQEALFASLLAHYGSGDAVGIVREKAERKVGEWACAPQGAALGYLVKFDPASARPLVEQAVQARGEGKTGCNHSIFQDIAHYSHDPMLREVALQTLDDPDPEVISDALIYLMSYGEAADEEAISRYYAAWSQKWQGRARELEAREAGSLTGNWKEIGLGENLARALIANQGWLASEKLIESTVDGCVGEQMCQQVKQWAGLARAKTYSISAYQYGEEENYGVAQYSSKSLELFEAKIAQFPKGSRFAVPDNQEQKQLDERVREILVRHGMVVEGEQQ